MESCTKVDPAVNCQRLREAMGVAQHHDAVSGTEKQHVADDYAKRLASGAAEANQVLVRVLSDWSKVENLGFCPLLNVSACPLTELRDSFTVLAYNPVAHPVNTAIRVPLAHAGPIVVHDSNLQEVASQLVEISPFTKLARGKDGNASIEVVFKAELPPMGYSSFSISPATGEEKLPSFKSEYSKPSDDFTISSSFLELMFSGTTGRMTQLTQVQSAGHTLSVPLDQQFLWYNASAGNNKASTQPSGAYIFRPNASKLFAVNNKDNIASVTVVRGPVVQEVWQVFSNFTAQIVRLYSDSHHAELEYIVGPIPFGDHNGKEVISRFDSNLKSDSVFYTDANGREMQRRVRNHRATWLLNNTEPVAGNYYPVNSRIFLQDMHQDIQLTILNDRSQGGSSLKDGSLELMVHRRLLVDDKRGVGEPLNETGSSGDGLVISGKHYLMLTTIADAPSMHRRLGLELMLEPLIAIGDYTSVGSSGSYVLSTNISSSVHILTLQRYYNSSNELLLRLENIFEASEGAGPVMLDLRTIFQAFDVTEAEELNLAANQLKRDVHRLKWKTATEGVAADVTQPLDDTMKVVLQPMEIRTFRIKID